MNRLLLHIVLMHACLLSGCLARLGGQHEVNYHWLRGTWLSEVYDSRTLGDVLIKYTFLDSGEAWVALNSANPDEAEVDVPPDRVRYTITNDKVVLFELNGTHLSEGVRRGGKLVVSDAAQPDHDNHKIKFTKKKSTGWGVPKEGRDH